MIIKSGFLENVGLNDGNLIVDLQRMLMSLIMYEYE